MLRLRLEYTAILTKLPAPWLPSIGKLGPTSQTVVFTTSYSDDMSISIHD